jgi:hypothetical protein
MTSPLFKSTLKSLAVASIVAASSFSHAAGNTCAYVFGNVEGKTVTTPALVIVVPETTVNLGPLRVHVDGTQQNIVGYEVVTPEVDETTPGESLFVPAVEEEVPSLSTTIHDVSVANKTCVSFGVTTPAVPVHVPASALAIPGAVLETPEVTVNTLGVSKTVAGQVVTVEGQTVVIPGADAVVPSITVDTPEKTISVDINGALHTANILDHQ